MEDEYLLTNQLGGYTASTFHFGNTRKYHGLLITANDNLDRKVIVSQLEEKILLDNQEKFLSTISYAKGATITPGAENLVNYSIHSQTACFEYQVTDAIKVFKEINLAQESNTVIIRYKIKTPVKLKFLIAPLITSRSIYELKRYTNQEEFIASAYLNNATIKFGKMDSLIVKVLSFNPKNLLNVSYKINTTPHIYNNLYYQEEAIRSYESEEDLIKPLDISFNIDAGESFISLQFSYHNVSDLPSHKINNTLKLVYSLDLRDKQAQNTPLIEFKEFLLKRYHSFLVDNQTRKSIVAGFPWFADWGRDTFISFPGLLLATGEFDFAKQVINYWMRYINDGLIPNSLNNKAYNTIDASLWFIISIYRYYLATGDKESLQAWYPKIRNIFIELINGSAYSIQVDGNGFLIWTDPTYNLTWMDSEVDGVSTTGRIGACVEIEMLWYNCLKIFEYFQKELGTKDDHQEITGLTKLVYQKFNRYFWNPTTEYANDFVFNENINSAIRPNVLLGLSLPFKLFDKKKTDKIIEKAGHSLYTEVGMLTLDKLDMKYNGYYQGSQKERDLSYHNGTIWPFLLGFYMKAILMNYPNDQARILAVREMLTAFWGQVKAQNLSYLPEVFAANDFHPDGCLAQAWNYAMFIEVYQLLP